MEISIKLICLCLLLPSRVSATGRRGIDYPPLRASARHPSGSDDHDPSGLPKAKGTDSSRVPGNASKLPDAESWTSNALVAACESISNAAKKAYKIVSNAYTGLVAAKVWGGTRLRRSGSMGDTEAANATMTDTKAAMPLEASWHHYVQEGHGAMVSTLLVSLEDLGTNTYKHAVGLLNALRNSRDTMANGNQTKTNAQHLRANAAGIDSGPNASAVNRITTLRNGMAHQGLEDNGFGTRHPLLAWEAMAIASLYAFIGVNAGSFVARAFQWPWLTSILVNIFVWPAVGLCYLLILIFGRGLAARQAKKQYFASSAKSAPDAKTLKDQSSALHNEAWCAYQVAHASHDLCVAKINNKNGMDEVVTPESLGKKGRVSEKGALRWYRWLSGSSSELTVGAMHVKTAELHCADAAKICNTLFALYRECAPAMPDTLSIGDALNVLQGWAAGKYGAHLVKTDDMNYLINTLLAALLAKSKCGSVFKADWMQLGDDYPQFFDVEPQYPQHVRYLRLLDSFRPELAQNLPRELFNGGCIESYKTWYATGSIEDN